MTDSADVDGRSVAAVLRIQADDPRAIAIVDAIRGGDVEALRQRLRDTPGLANARIVDRRGVARSLLHAVADWPGHFPNGPQVVALLAAAGADVNARVIHASRDGAPATPLHWAASSGDVAVLDALLDAGADIEAPGAAFTGGSPLSDAVVFAQWGAARALLDRGAGTTLWQAAALGVLDRVRDLCGADPPPSHDRITNAFWHACRGGQQPTAAYLLDRGADIDRVAHDRKTPLDAARESGDEALLRWLRERGARSAAPA